MHSDHQIESNNFLNTLQQQNSAFTQERNELSKMCADLQQQLQHMRTQHQHLHVPTSSLDLQSQFPSNPQIGQLYQKAISALDNITDSINTDMAAANICEFVMTAAVAAAFPLQQVLISSGKQQQLVLHSAADFLAGVIVMCYICVQQYFTRCRSNLLHGVASDIIQVSWQPLQQQQRDQKKATAAALCSHAVAADAAIHYFVFVLITGRC